MDALQGLINALRGLPGIGPKSAQRMAFQLLQHPRQRGMQLARCLERAMQHIQHCKTCNNYTETEHCTVCMQPSRDRRMLCVVETPTDLLAIEQSQVYQGLYYVLMGKISPLDGIGPEDIALNGLVEQIKQGELTEIILALSPTIEGQATMHFIQAALQPFQIKISQLAHGIPVGSELEFLNANTISGALRNRGAVNA